MDHSASSLSVQVQRTLSQLKFAAKAWRECSRDRVLPADRWLARTFQENRKVIGSRDRKFISGAVHAVFRNQTYYDYWIQKFAQSDLRDPVKQAKFMCLLGAAGEGLIDSPVFAAAWNEIKDRAQLEHPEQLFEAVRKNAIPEVRGEASPSGWLALRYSFPEWLIERWTRDFGAEECEKLLAATHERPPLVIRVNTLKISRDELLKKLDPAAGAAPVQGIPYAIAFREHAQLKTNEAFTEGLFEVQAAASQRAAEMVAPRPGEKIWDVCAGSGGKTLFFAAMMQNQGQITATDLRSLALKELKTRAERAGAAIIKVADIQRFYRGEVRELFDKIIVDAPCSGTGTIARAPDLKWRLEEKSFEDYAEKQLEILDAVLPYLKPEGRLYYMTCSIDKAENEGVLKTFLNRHADWTIDDLNGKAAEGFRIWPHRDHTDGFFLACFKKKERL